MSNMSILLDAGFDAFKNLYQVDIQLPPSLINRLTDTGLIFNQDLLSTNQQILSLRAVNFKIPSLNLGQYPVDFRTVTLERPNAMFEGERAIELTFRIDGYFDVYTIFQQWKQLYLNYITDEVALGTLSGTLSNTFLTQETDGAISGGNSDLTSTSIDQYGTIKVHALASVDGYAPIKHWGFGQVMCANLTEPQFTRSGSEALTFGVKFLFGQEISPEAMID